MPIFDFDKCIQKLKNYYSLGNNTIFIGILESNDQRNKNGQLILNTNAVNSTKYQFFISNGTILNHSICNGIEVKVNK